MTAFRKMLKNKPNTATSTLVVMFMLNYFFAYCTSQLYEGSTCVLSDGSLGICKSFILCRWAIQGLKQRVITYTALVRCSFEGVNEIICCQDERPPTPDIDVMPTSHVVLGPNTTPPNRIPPYPIPVTSSIPPLRIGKRRSEIACENYTLLSSPPLNWNILGGLPSVLSEFPHMAALGFPSQEFEGNEYDFNCGASIISENWVLTAAHCVSERILPTIVRSGKITLLTNDDGLPGVTSTIAEIIPHPNYTPSRRYNDIALIRVSSPIPFEEFIRPACLRSNMSDIDADVQLTVTGWGRTSVERAQQSNVLLKTNLTGVTLESCNASLYGYNANNRRLRNGLNLGQICAYDPQARHDSCEGDWGGTMQIASPNGVSTIVGVASFGISCGSGLPSVYTRVAFYLDWIESIVWPNR